MHRLISRSLVLLLLAVLAAGCGADRRPRPMTSAGGPSDPGPGDDGAGSDDPGDPGDPGDPDDQNPDDGDGDPTGDGNGDGDGDGGEPASCDGVQCGAGTVCDAGACVPDPDGGDDADGRTADDVCGRWMQDHVQVAVEHDPGEDSGACAPGTVTSEGQENGLRRTNLYRWLAGLGPVQLEPSLLRQEQECATLMAAMGGLSHTPPSNAPCWTPDASAAAGSSNLALGSGLADSVDMYVDDGGVPSLGHRRWVLNPTAQVTAFGYYPRASCMYSFSQGGASTVDYVAWPPPGYVPVSAAKGRWHVSFYGSGVQPTPSVAFEVTIGDGEPERVDADALPRGYGGGQPAYAFDVPRSVWQDGKSVTVRVSGLVGEDIVYTVRFVACR